MRVDAIVQIERAELSAQQYRAARRLLDNASQVGHIKLTKDAASELCGTTSEGALRRLLGHLQRKELIHYSVNGFVYIDFTAFPPATESDLVRAESDHPRALFDHPRAKSDHPRALDEGDEPLIESDQLDPSARVRAKSDHPRAKSDHPRAKSDHPRAKSDHHYTHAGAGVGWLVGSILPTNEDEPTNQPTPALSVALLLAAGIMPRNAKRLAATVGLERIRQAVGHWWEHQNDQFRSPGIIVTWLDDWESAGIPACSAAFRRSDLYRASLTTEELAEEQSVAATVVPPPVADEAAPAEDLSPLAALWAEILQGFAVDAPEIHDAWLVGTQLIALDEAMATITAPPAKVERVARLERRLRTQLALHGRRVERITVKEVGDGP